MALLIHHEQQDEEVVSCHFLECDEVVMEDHLLIHRVLPWEVVVDYHDEDVLHLGEVYGVLVVVVANDLSALWVVRNGVLLLLLSFVF